MSEPLIMKSHVGVVAIGRNEGERLRRCLDSVVNRVAAVIYVDSGSSDGSEAMARSLGADVVDLDLGTAFTAARARNAGIARLVQLRPDIEFVQVVDGDCEIVDGWLERAMQEMQGHPKAAVVCGRRRERFPEASVYNQLCDMEWNTSIREAEACGGDALIRLAVFKQIGGYDESIIAGEEPEMCLRMRLQDWKVHRIDHEMTLHDAQMTQFSQWWRRNVRSGHAYAEGRAMHGVAHGFCVREVRSIVEWTLILPLIVLGLAWFTWGFSLLLLGGYAWLWYRIRSHRLSDGDTTSDASLYASYCVMGKFAQMQGIARYWWNRLRGRRSRIIEYKGAEQSLALSAVPEARKT